MKKILLVIFSVITTLCILLVATYNIMIYLYPRKYSEFVKKYADEYGLEQSLVYAIIKCESNFDPSCVSHAGAIGLMQITVPTFEWAALKANDTENTQSALYNQQINIKYGCYIFSIFYNEFADIKTALACYNAGRGKVLSWLENSEYSDDGILLKKIPYSETDNYVKKVKTVKQIYELLY